MYFILPNLNDLRAGSYPPDPSQNGRPGYEIHNQAAFVKAAEIAAEVDIRMSEIKNSIALELRYTEYPAWNIERIAKSLHWEYETLEQEMTWMLRYIAGRKRKVDDFVTWKAKAQHKKRYFLSLDNAEKIVDKLLNSLNYNESVTQ